MGLSYEEGKKAAYKGFVLLLIVTLLEVGVALVGNGHVIPGFELSKVIMYPVMIILSLYKAYFIVQEFMHMKYEAKGLAMTVILPTLLLVWAVIAFLQEGNFWKFRRAQINDKAEMAKPAQSDDAKQESYIPDPSEFIVE